MGAAASTLVPYQLPTQTWAAGSRTVQSLRDLPKQYLGKLAHLAKIVFSPTLSPTYAAAFVTTVGHNNLFTSLDFYDGQYMRFQGGFNHLRAKERMHTGRIRLADATTAAGTTNARVFKRVLHMGPPQFSNSPADFVVPTGILENAELRIQHGALADLTGATVTACTGSMKVTAWLMLLDSVNLPPAYQYTNQATTAGDVQLSGRALYESIALVTDSTFAAWTAGQIGNVRLDLGAGDIIPSIRINDLAAAMHDDFNAGEVGAVAPEPEVTTYDTNYSIINRGANPATALATPANDLAPVLWSPQNQRITKMPKAESVARLKWDGSQGTGTVLVGRILPQPPSVLAANLGRAIGRLNLNSKIPKVKTASKETYVGPLGEFMPWKASVS